MRSALAYTRHTAGDSQCSSMCVCLGHSEWPFYTMSAGFLLNCRSLSYSCLYLRLYQSKFFFLLVNMLLTGVLRS